MKVKGIPLPLSQSCLDKFCKRCSTTKKITEFSRNRTKNDGLGSWCKLCNREFQSTPDQIQKQRDRSRRSRLDPFKHRQHLKWRNLPENKAKHRLRARIYKEKHYDKVRVREIATAAIRRGELKPMPCEICQNPKVDSHHDDYSKPFEVRWLCRKHHNELHFSKPRLA